MKPVMKIPELAQWLIFIVVIIAIIILGCVGCGQVILRDPNGTEIVKINTFLKDIKFDEVAYQDWLIKRYSGESKNVEIYTPSGVVKASDSNE